ncbi:peptidoglycan editing factor PgeF [Alicyclobacillus dauci]|uniref:Purine nucleoside phosphorylase n=1 Tax=Alicyclobacillus dauci TaxID=1475485 RepID=A0ABY6YY66_9BACL|nr:peptidoglycan editing factor PgeF [Alicyclobacillus dauci]WAH35522.1 peptidoglycan editing factor PgeF [Alicyclobacillus dauci]
MLTNWLNHNGGLCVQPGWTESGVHALFSFRHHPNDREGGLDVAFHSRVSEDSTLESRQVVATELGVSLDCFVFVRQVHGADVAVVDAAHRGLGATKASPNRMAADALVTNDKNVALAILTADCVPILFYDPVRKAIGAAHSGWRGTVSHISKRVVETMQKTYGTQPEDLLVSIGPSIRICCYEVDEVVAGPVHREFTEKVIFPRFNRAGKFWFSMQSAICSDLLTVGVRDEHIDDTGICTSCRSTHLFSHRREQGNAGRQMAAIALT